jgi:hypothetical protein
MLYRSTRASDIPMAPAWQVSVSQAIRDATREVLPDEWRVLPDGRSTASVIAKVTAEKIRDVNP